MDTAQVKILAGKYLDGTATPEEAAALHQWYDQANAGDTEIVLAEQATTLEDTRLRMLRQMQAQIAESRNAPAVMRPAKRIWLPAAAAVLLLVAAGGYLLRQPGKQPTTGTTATQQVPANRPTLTLGNGTVVDLSTQQDGSLAQQGGTSISKQQSQLVYEAGANGGKPVINKLTVPKGSQFRLVLPDGTKAWLNAASELLFPSDFEGGQRLVQLEGEGYFEVVTNAAQPFVVQTGGMQIEVLGTQFNVKAYRGEPNIQAALLEGSVRIVTGAGKGTIMRPGEVATVDSAATVRITKDPDVAQAAAWKDGVFSFRNADIAVILREIGRWYDVEIVYSGPVTHRRFTGKVSRTYSLSETLSVLLASDLHFRQEGKKVIVLP